VAYAQAEKDRTWLAAHEIENRTRQAKKDAEYRITLKKARDEYDAFFERNLAELEGKVLDCNCGQVPWKHVQTDDCQ